MSFAGALAWLIWLGVRLKTSDPARGEQDSQARSPLLAGE